MASYVIYRDEVTGTTAEWNKNGTFKVVRGVNGVHTYMTRQAAINGAKRYAKRVRDALADRPVGWRVEYRDGSRYCMVDVYARDVEEAAVNARHMINSRAEILTVYPNV